MHGKLSVWGSGSFRAVMVIFAFSLDCMFLQPLLGQLAYRSDSKGSTRPYKPTPRALEPIDEFFLVLTRLRLGSLERDLAERFRISTTTISRICTAWINYLDKQLRLLITWPSRSLIDKHMPSQFRELYPITRVILDCTEIFTDCLLRATALAYAF